MSHLPISAELRFVRIPTQWTREKEELSGRYDLAPKVDQHPERKLRPILDDPRDLRTEFFKLPHNEDAALAFLNKIGVWETWKVTTISSGSSREGSTVTGQALDGAFGYRHFRNLAVLPVEIKRLWREQRYWKYLLNNPTALRKQFFTPPRDEASPADKEAFAIHTKFGNTLEIHLECKKGQVPRAVIQPMTGRELLVATAWLDIVQQEKIQICQRTDCGLPFTGREQKYCSDSCGHLMAVRAFRERKRRAGARRGRKRKAPKSLR